MPDADTGGPLRGARIVLGITGSIAAYKAAEITRLLVKAGAEVRPLMTEAATRFIPELTISTLAGHRTRTGLFPEGAPEAWTEHVALGLWADAILVAPATAQTLAKLAGGFCDNMLTAAVLSARCPVMVAPAMDHDMWRHPATRRTVATLRADGVRVVEPARGELASGLVGDGRLPEPDALVARLGEWLAAMPPRTERTDKLGETPVSENKRLSELPYSGRRVLVTAGPTREAIDPVRFLSNGSTGTMGFALAGAAAQRGANVTLVSGPVVHDTPPGVTRIDVESADAMLAAAQAVDAPDLVIAAAAVSDYAPVDVSERKLKKSDADLTLALRRTPDILATLAAGKTGEQVFVGFALESHDGEAHARAKLERKRLDWIALNRAGADGEGFGRTTNRVTLLSAGGARRELPLAPKAEIAEALLDAIAATCAERWSADSV